MDEAVADTSGLAMKLVSEANNAASSGLASTGEWPPRFTQNEPVAAWWGAHGSSNQQEEEKDGKEHKSTAKSRKTRTLLQQAGRNQVSQNNTKDSNIQKNWGYDPLSRSIDGFLNRPAPKLPSKVAKDPQLKSLRGQLSNLRKFQSGNTSAVKQRKDCLSRSDELQSSTGGESSKAALVNMDLVNEAFDFVERMGSLSVDSEALMEVEQHRSKITGKRKIRKKGRKRLGRKTSLCVNPKQSANSSSLVKTKNGRRRGKNREQAFIIREQSPESRLDVDKLVESLSRGSQVQKLKSQLEQSKQSLSQSEAFIQNVAATWFK